MSLATLPLPAYPHPRGMGGNPNFGKPPIVLTIAGFDPSSGAGATADLQVFATMGLFGTACLTALTVQSTAGVARVQPIDAALLDEMLRFLSRDLPPAGIKIGMLGDAEITRVVADFLDELQPKSQIPIVIDPVLRSSSGASMLEDDALNLFLERLLPQATCITPNRAELSVLIGKPDLDQSGLAEAAESLLGRSHAQSVIVTGGDAASPTDLLLESGSAAIWLEGRRVATDSTHGTGCAFSSALLSRLVLGDTLADAAKRAKLFVENGLRDAPGIGLGKGPMKLSASTYAR